MRLKQNLTGIFIFIFALPVGFSASELPQPLRLSFREALKIAQERNVDVIVSNERVQQAVMRLGQAVAVLLPQVTATASQSRKTINLEAMGIEFPAPPAAPGVPPTPAPNPVVGPFNSFDARISVTQALFDVEALERLRVARAGKRISLVGSRKAKQDVLALVANLYIEAKRAQDSVEVANALVKRDEERLRIAKNNRRTGVGSDLELKQAQAQLSESRRQWYFFSADALSHRLDLSAALGIPNGQPVIFVEENTPRNMPVPEENELPKILNKHPDIEFAQQTLQQSKAERWVEWGRFFPKVSGFADYGASGETPSNSEATYTFGAKMTLPLFEGGSRYFRVREAASRVRENQARLVDTEHQTEAKALNAEESVRRAQALLEAAEANSAVSSQQLVLAKNRLQTGFGSHLEVLEALAQNALVQDQKSEAIAAYRMAEVNLAHALGRVEELIEKDIKP